MPAHHRVAMSSGLVCQCVILGLVCWTWLSTPRCALDHAALVGKVSFYNERQCHGWLTPWWLQILSSQISDGFFVFFFVFFLYDGQQFQFSIVHRAGKDHGNADSLSRVPSSPCRQCTRPDCSPADVVTESVDQPFDSELTGSSEDSDLIPIHSREDWVALLDDDLSQLATVSGDTFHITTLQKQDPVCITLLSWITSGDFPPWIKIKGLSPELRLLWHHRNNLSVDDNGVIWRKRISQSHMLQLLVFKSACEQLFLSYHASLFGGHLGRNRTLARLAHRFYWFGMSDDVKEWLGQCTVCIKRISLTGRHHPLGNIPTGHRWDRIAMDILDVCDPTPDGYRYILVIADYFSKWMEAFPIKNKCADTVADWYW